MRLYLVQHGDAAPEQVDPRRPLSETGRRQVDAVGRLLADASVRVARIVHSGKDRAQQTAELLAAALASGGAVETMPGLAPNDPVEPVAHTVAELDGDTMLVGHLPFMARLAARLVAAEEGLAVVAFVPGTVLCLEPAAEGRWTIAWMIRPALAPGAA
jgi:phosphohistidine phosphatase